MVYFDQIMHRSAGNDQFAFHTFLLAPGTDQSSESTFTTGRAHYGQLIQMCLRFCSTTLIFCINSVGGIVTHVGENLSGTVPSLYMYCRPIYTKQHVSPNL